jgi:hypothetical protein
MSEPYFCLPLEILRYGSSALESVEAALCYGIVHAGLTFLRDTDEDEFEERFLEGAEELGINVEGIKYIEQKAAVVGADRLKVSLGDVKTNAQTYLAVQKAFNPKLRVRIKGKILWNAVNAQRAEAGQDIPESWKEEFKKRKPISFRELRVFLALLSEGENRHGFKVVKVGNSVHKGPMMWRSAGFLNKGDFLNAPNHKEHCPPLTERQIRSTLENLEALNFFAAVPLRRQGAHGGSGLAVQLTGGVAELAVKVVSYYKEREQNWKRNDLLENRKKAAQAMRVLVTSKP